MAINPNLIPVTAPRLMVPQQVPTLLASGDPAKTSSLLRFIDPEIAIRASEWVGFKTPDGKMYYFSNKTKQSIWEKPKVLVDFEGEYGSYFLTTACLMLICFPPDALERAKKEQERLESTNNGNSQPVEVRNSSQPEVITVDSSESDKKEIVNKDKSKPISSTPITGTPW